MLQGKSGLSANEENLLLPNNMAQFAGRTVGNKPNNLAVVYVKCGLSAVAYNPISPNSLKN